MNDTYGHNVGDNVVREAARIIQGTIRNTEFEGRRGGEECIIVASDTALNYGTILAERIRHEVASNQFAHDSTVTLSLGFRQFKAGEGLNQLLVRIDVALYKAKKRGRNRVEIAEM